MDDGSRIGFDRILIATGRRPRVDGLQLERAGITVDLNGWVDHDASMRTTNHSVWPAGDVAGLPKHTHTAGLSGATVARNALLGTRRKFGVRPDDRDPHRHQVLTMSHRHVDRAVAEHDTSGFTKIVSDRRGRILGGTIAGPRAGETWGELALAVGTGVSGSRLAGITHPYPTYNDGVWNAVLAESQRRIREGAVGRVAARLRHADRLFSTHGLEVVEDSKQRYMFALDGVDDIEAMAESLYLRISGADGLRDAKRVFTGLAHRSGAMPIPIRRLLVRPRRRGGA